MNPLITYPLPPEPRRLHLFHAALAGLLLILAPSTQSQAQPQAASTESVAVDKLSLQGGVEDGRGSFILQGTFRPATEDHGTLYAVQTEVSARITPKAIDQSVLLTARPVRGNLKELRFQLSGQGEILDVTGDHPATSSVGRETDQARFLLIQLAEEKTPPDQVQFTVSTRTTLDSLPARAQLLSFSPPTPELHSGYLQLHAPETLALDVSEARHLIPIPTDSLPESMALNHSIPDQPTARHAFRFLSGVYLLELGVRWADPDAGRIVVDDFRLNGHLDNDHATFTLHATVHVHPAEGGRIDLLSGPVAITDFAEHPDYRIDLRIGAYELLFDKAGEFDIQVEFDSKVRRTDGWSKIEFQVLPAELRPVYLTGIPQQTELRASSAAKPQWQNDQYLTFLSATAPLHLQWQDRQPEIEGKLFYAAEGALQATIGPGLMRQIHLIDFQIMQGDMRRAEFTVEGSGEITQVQGNTVLSWSMETEDGSRRLIVLLNKPQKNGFALRITTQTPLGTFPEEISPVKLAPLEAIRYGGHVRLVNDGAVRLEVTEASGLSQISPDQLKVSDELNQRLQADPALSDALRILNSSAGQVFAFRFSGTDYDLQIQADDIQPEITVSQLLVYRLGDGEATIDAELELEIREAPLREFNLLIPQAYTVAALQAPHLADYFISSNANNQAELRMVFSQPLDGRQLIRTRLEQANLDPQTTWQLPRIEAVDSKSVRGHVAVASAPGLRLTPGVTQGVTEIATAYFPRQIEGVQSAFRIRDRAWEIAVQVEQLELSLQVDSFHLFSIGEGISYGSTVLHYAISGAPVSVLEVTAPDDYANLEFTGKNIRNWIRTERGYEIRLHSPVSGAYTLLATYEQQFDTLGATLPFQGLAPLDAQSERGYTVIISAYQFHVQTAHASPDLIPLERPELPAEYRLLFDAPVLAAYQFTSRPFDLQLTLTPLDQGETVAQVVDRALLDTRVSSEGQVLTSARYFMKTKGASHLRVQMPPGLDLWTATVNENKVVPVLDNGANLIPLPRDFGPGAILAVQLNVASKSQNRHRVQVAAPIVTAPIVLTEWKIQSDPDHRLTFEKGSLQPDTPNTDLSGFSVLLEMLKGQRGAGPTLQILVALAGLFSALILWRWGLRQADPAKTFRLRLALITAGSAMLLALLAVVLLIASAAGAPPPESQTLAFTAPALDAGSTLRLQLNNIPHDPTAATVLLKVWPLYLGLALFIAAFLKLQETLRFLAILVAWLLVFWGALRVPNSASFFFLLFLLFLLLHVLIPAGKRARHHLHNLSRPADPGPAAALILLGLLPLHTLAAPPATSLQPESARTEPVAESIIQQAHIEEGFVHVEGRVRWQGRQHQRLPFLRKDTVITDISTPAGVKLRRDPASGSYQLVAEQDGAFDITFRYQTPVTAGPDGESGFHLPTRSALINRLTLHVAGQEVEVFSSHAVSILPCPAPKADADADADADAGRSTCALLVLEPASDPWPWIGWRPRTREVETEEAVFYVEMHQLYIPTAGVVEGVHAAHIRPAQGQVKELHFLAPDPITIIDVQTPSLSAWRFDPETHQLRIFLEQPQAESFALQIRSQIATQPLPYTRTVPLLSLQDAAGQVGLAAVATGSEVQLENASGQGLSQINLEDFPPHLAAARAREITGLTTRRAFRYSDPSATLTVAAAPVQPDIRVISEETLSLGEDRILLAANLTVHIHRAGIFKLSFLLPEGMDVESLSGSALSHWTELTNDSGRIVTLHLRSKTSGQHQFSISLVGPGLAATSGWNVPRLTLREAAKHQGRLLIIPEQGLRVQVQDRQDVTLLDPETVGVRQKGVLALRLLSAQWQLALDVEQVDAWIQTAVLQDVTVREGQVKVRCNLHYQIDNTGVKSFSIWLPDRAETVSFTGEQVADFVPGDSNAEGLRLWEVKLHRRVIASYTLHLSYQIITPERPEEMTITGVRAEEVNIQRGYLAIRAGGRIQVRVPEIPRTLQKANWRQVPAALRQQVPDAEPLYLYRVLESHFALPVRVVHHEAADLLPARVESVELLSVLSELGTSLTQVTVRLDPGDKRLLRVELPPDARFWLALVNQRGVIPWRNESGDAMLIPLEPNTPAGSLTTVDFVYLSTTATQSHPLDQLLQAPRFDLPLQNISWKTYIPLHWDLAHWDGTLQLVDEHGTIARRAVDLTSYLSGEQQKQQAAVMEAENLLQLGNSLLQEGDPQRARQAFESAQRLSLHDDAFSEDARVQLQNLKEQQAIMGLNFRRNSLVPEERTASMPDPGTRYTQQQARQVLQQNAPEENAILTQLAQRLVHQQEAAMVRPDAIRPSIPEQGRLFTFSRSLLVDPQADLVLELELDDARRSGNAARFLLLASLFLCIGLFTTLARTSPR